MNNQNDEFLPLRKKKQIFHNFGFLLTQILSPTVRYSVRNGDDVKMTGRKIYALRGIRTTHLLLSGEMSYSS